MTDNHSIRCPVCLHDFDTKERLPKISTACGHTICKECLTQVLMMDRPQCPLDKLSFNRNLRTADAFPTNFLGKDLLEIESLWSKCPIHDEPKKMICLTDHTLVCANCVLFGDHKDHEVKLLSDLQDIAKVKKQELETMYTDISNNCAHLHSSLEEKQKSMKEIIKQGFQRLHVAIDQQQADMLSQLEKTFAEEKTRLEIMMSKSSQLSFDVQNKVKEFSNYRCNPNIAKLVEEDYSDLKKMAGEEHMKTLMKHTKDLSQLLVLFQEALPAETSLKALSPIQPLTQKLAEYNDKRNSEQTEQLEDDVSFSVELNIQLPIFTPNTLKIESSTKKNTYTFDRSELEQITAVSYKFKLNDDIHVSLILPALMILSRYLVNVKSIHIDVDAGSKLKSYESAFGSLILACFLQPENLKSIQVNAPNLIVRDVGLLYLCQKVLPQVKDLEKFDCNFKFAQITSAALRALRKADFKAMPNLQKFKLNLSGNHLNESQMKKFLLSLPNIKELELGLTHMGLKDEILENFSTNTLPQMDKVETLEIDFSDTKITDKGVDKLMKNLPLNLSHLQLGLNSLKVTDFSLQPFLNNKLPSLTKLEYLKIDVEKTSVSRDLKRKIRDWKIKEQPQIKPQKAGLFANLDTQMKELSDSLKLLCQQPPKLYTEPLFKAAEFNSAASQVQTGLFSKPLSGPLFPHTQKKLFEGPLLSNFAEPALQSSNQTTPPKQRAFN